MFIRFVVSAHDEDSRLPKGIFTALYELEEQGELAAHEREWFRTTERWFARHLKFPTRVARSSRPHAPGQAISWLKLSATEHLSRMRDLVSLLEHKDILVQELRTERPGYIVYEDEHQVLAEPFAHETFASGRA